MNEDDPRIPGGMSADQIVAAHEGELASELALEPEPHTDATRYMYRREFEWFKDSIENSMTPPEPEEQPPFRRSHLKRHEVLLRLKAAALLERHAITIETNGREPLTAILRRFPDASAVLETEVTGRTRGLRPLEEHDFVPKHIAWYLELALLNAQRLPIPGQGI